MQTIADMSIEEFNRLIEKLVDERLRYHSKKAEISNLDEIISRLEKNRWTPPQGAKSPTELLREDRDA